MDYLAFNKIPFYAECAPLVEGMGCRLVELAISPAKTTVKITAVIAPEEPGEAIGVDDCARVHRVLLPRLKALLGKDDVAMELTSPGVNRNIKNAAEFELFTGRLVRVWDKRRSDWVGGKIARSGESSVTLQGEDGEELTVPLVEIAKAKFA